VARKGWKRLWPFFFDFTCLYELNYWPLEGLKYLETPRTVRKTLKVEFGLNIRGRRVTIITTKHIAYFKVAGRY
jgi:hypothetical protein